MNPPYSPYQIPVVPPSGYWLGPIDELLAPARRAGLLMIIIGSLSLLGGVCVLAILALPVDQLIRDSKINPADIASTGLTPQQFIKFLVIMMSSIFIATAVAMLVMGFLVRRGGIAAAIVSLVMVSVLVLLTTLYTLGQVVNAFRDPRMILAVGICLAILGVLVLLIVWLIGAIRSAGALKNLKQQQLAQWYAMQQHPAWTGYGPTPPQQSGGGLPQ